MEQHKKAAAPSAARRSAACAADGTGIIGGDKHQTAGVWRKLLHPATAAALQHNLDAAQRSAHGSTNTTNTKGGVGGAYLLPPAFPGTPPTIYFDWTAAPEAVTSGTSNSSCSTSTEKCTAASGGKGHALIALQHTKLCVRYIGGTSKPVKQAFKQAGFQATTKPGSSGWSVLWGRPADVLTDAVLKSLNPLQRVNHFPGAYEGCCWCVGLLAVCVAAELQDSHKSHRPTLQGRGSSGARTGCTATCTDG